MPLVLDPIQSGYNLSKINDNFQRIEDTWDEKLDRVNSGSFYNQMDQTLDMNSNEIINVKVGDTDNSLVTKGYVDQQDELRVLKAGDSMSGQLNTIDPVDLGNATNKRYVDGRIATIDGVDGIVPLVSPRQQGDGVTTVFPTIVTSQHPTQSYSVNLDGVTQRPQTDYTADTNGNVVFAEAPEVGVDIDITVFEPVNLQEAADFSQVTSTGSTTPRTLADRFAEVVNVKDFGAIGDGVTDDAQAIQNARDAAYSSDRILFFPNGQYYVQSTVYLGDVKVYAEEAGYTDPIFARCKDGTNFVNGTTSPNWDYYYNVAGNGQSTTWQDHLTSYQGGAAICSDVASPVVSLVDGEKFDIDGLGVIGNHRLVGQHGIATNLVYTYNGNKHFFKNVRVTGCGGSGIWLVKGWETSEMDGCILTGNNEYGLYTGVLDDNGTIIDSATEYITVTNTGASHNRLGGFYFEQMRKHLLMDNVYGNNNGQYDSSSTNGRIDALLGYDRNLPLTREPMAALIRVNDVTQDSVGATGFCFGLNFKNIWAEQVAKMIHIRGEKGAGVLRNVSLENITGVRLAQMGGLDKDDPANGCLVYMDVNYLAEVDIKTTYEQALYPLDVENVTTTENNIRALGWTPITTAEFDFLHWKYEGTLGSFTFASAAPIVRDDFQSPAVNETLISTVIKDTHTFYPSPLVLAPVSQWRIVGQHQATNNKSFGIYDVHVFRNNLGGYSSVVTKIGEHPTDGDSFTAAPTVSNDGTLNLPTKAFSMVRVELITEKTWIGGVSV